MRRLMCTYVRKRKLLQVRRGRKQPEKTTSLKKRTRCVSYSSFRRFSSCRTLPLTLGRRGVET